MDGAVVKAGEPARVPARKRAAKRGAVNFQGGGVGMFIGIDPGKSGAMAAISRDGSVVFDFEDPQGIAFLRLNRHEVALAALEKVSAMPKQGVASSFNFGANFGIWQGRLEALAIPFVFVTPQKWQKTVFDSARKGDRKAMSLDLARRLFPAMAEELKRKKDDGRADALLIAEYARRLGSDG